jgi:hypothetical protein
MFGGKELREWRAGGEMPGAIGCVVIRPDGSGFLARVVGEELAQQKPD